MKADFECSSCGIAYLIHWTPTDYRDDEDDFDAEDEPVHCPFCGAGSEPL